MTAEKNKRGPYVIGLDFGSLSCRGILADSRDGSVLCEAEYAYPHAIITAPCKDLPGLSEKWCLQDPDDYREALVFVLRELFAKSCVDPEAVAAVGVDATASTVLAVDKECVPLCKKEEYKARIHAWPKMWKHHAAFKEAADLTRAAREFRLPWLDSVGGEIGAEFFVSKVLECFREDRQLFDDTDTFLELGDWIVSLLAGQEIRSRTFLACKAMWSEASGFPPEEYFDAAERGFGSGYYAKMTGRSQCICFPGEAAAEVSETMAALTGLAPGTVITAAQMDGYAGIPGSGICEAGVLMMVLGTSTSFMLLDERDTPVEGICASMPDSIYRGLLCHAAGQPGTGDMLQWYMENALPGSCERKAKEEGISVHEYLSRLAGRSGPDERLLCLAWFNGSKSVPIDLSLTGVISGFSLSTKPEQVYRCLIEGSAFGAKAIIEHIKAHGVPIREIICSGGMSWKNPFLMQIYADILNCDLKVCAEKQTVALGSAIYAAASAGLYPDVPSAARGMSGRISRVYTPTPESGRSYQAMYKNYLALRRSILS